ncbi:MAG TPA: FHA domain-containing protein [Steroidobacteraceae bacterium]|nr:FHA domain-containing protein [Steroidobacteraceae bacterium]
MLEGVMAVNPHPPASQEIDLEATAELPRLDFDPAFDGGTDTFIALATPADLSELADSLRDVERRLKRKTERLRELEEQLAVAAAAQQQLRDDLDSERRTVAEQLEQERRSAASQLDEMRRSTAAQAAELRHQARDLEELRRRTERQDEALRHSQGLRGVLEGLLAEGDGAVADIEARHAAEMAARDERTARQLHEAVEREAKLKSESESTLAAMRQAQVDHAAQLVAERAAHAAALAQALEAQRREAAAEVAEREVALRATLAQQQEELAELRANDEAACAGIEIFEQQRQRIGALESELAVAQEWANQLEQDQNASREQILRLESDARESMSLLGNLQQNIARLGQEDSGARPGLKVVGDPLPERYLESVEDGTEAVHPLGRRTTIGRTPDNDIQIVATFISRNHAVMLGSAEHCILEDLNSTNGVAVNGRRVTRHALHDGDIVTIGQTRFRYRQST